MKRILLTLILLMLFINIYSEDVDIHRFGLTIEGGYSGANRKNDPLYDYYPQTFLGNFGGTFFYQFTLSKYFALRPELGLYSYFFKLPLNYYADYSSYNAVYSSFNGRVGISAMFYFYRNNVTSWHFDFAPLISMRFYDSAKMYFNADGSRDFYFSVGILLAFGVESTNNKPVGTGGSIFFRLVDKPDNNSQKTLLIPSVGGSISLFW